MEKNVKFYPSINIEKNEQHMCQVFVEVSSSLYK